MSWRLGLGFLLAAFAEVSSIFIANRWAAQPPHGVDRGATWAGWCFTLLIAASLFAIVRFGVFDTISRLSVTLALLTAFDLFFWWTPFVRPASRAVMVVVILLSCLTDRGRSALVRVIGAVVAGGVVLFGLAFLVDRAMAQQCRGGCNFDLHNAPIVLLLLPAAFLLSSAVVAGVLNRRKSVA